MKSILWQYRLRRRRSYGNRCHL